MKEQTPPLTERQQYWLKQLRACEHAGQGMKAYALSQGLDIQALYSWKKALVKKGFLPRTRLPRFQQAHVVAAVVDSEWQIQLPNGVSVAFVSPMDARTLSTVLNTAAAIE
jgi:hypothetical protein